MVTRLAILCTGYMFVSWVDWINGMMDDYRSEILIMIQEISRIYLIVAMIIIKEID